MKEQCQKLWIGRTKKFLALENFLIGGIVSMEVCKIFGKYRPLKQTLYLQTNFESQKWADILNKKLFIIGAGGKTHELIKILCSLCRFYQ